MVPVYGHRIRPLRQDVPKARVQGLGKMTAGYSNSTTPMDDRDEARTPGAVYWWVTKIFGKCDIDLAATAENALCDRYFTKEDDALSQLWGGGEFGERGWCNPPYSEPDKWISAAIWEAQETGFETLMLLPSLNSNKYEQKIFEFARFIFFFVGRIQFLRPDGRPFTKTVPVTGKQTIVTNPRGSILVQFKPKEYGQVDPAINYVRVEDIEHHRWANLYLEVNG